jgi:hypothetical protein
MPSPFHRSRARRATVVLGLMVAALLAFAASASATSLSVSMSKTTITRGTLFTFTLSGSGIPGDEFDRVIAFTQPSRPFCKSTPQQEGASFPPARLSVAVTEFPFRVSKTLRSSALGYRRVCAYLYSGDVGVTVLRATKVYHVVLPLCRRGQTRGCRRR